jgi:hypothetical protein
VLPLPEEPVLPLDDVLPLLAVVIGAGLEPVLGDGVAVAPVEPLLLVVTGFATAGDVLPREPSGVPVPSVWLGDDVGLVVRDAGLVVVASGLDDVVEAA